VSYSKNELSGMQLAVAINRSQSELDRPATRRRINVCQVVHGLPIGGAEVLVNRIVRALGDRYRFVIACLDQVGELGESLAADGVTVVNLGRRPGFDWKCVRRLQRLCAEEHIEAIHAHQYTPFAYSVATRAFGRRPPVLFTEHGRFYPDYPNLKRKIFNWLLPNRRDRFVAVGEAVRQALIHNEGLPPRRVEVVYNGVDLSAFEREASEREQIRRQLGLLGDEFVVLQVARLDTIKDHATAIRSIAAARAKCPALKFLVVGDGPERSSIEQMIASEKLGDQVVMLGSRHDVPCLLAAADAFLLTSLSEGIPVTIIEAMAAGVPVVATAGGGVPELITDNRTGLLRPVGDAAGLAEAVVRLADDEALRTRLTSGAREHVWAHFSEAEMIDHYDRILREMVAAEAPAA
jgi:L-malate glycosyltransferase